MLMHFLEGESVRFFCSLHANVLFYFTLWALWHVSGGLSSAAPLFCNVSIAVVLYRLFMSFIAYADC
jgi:hypothetical protein